MLSAWLRASTNSRCFLSSSACFNVFHHFRLRPDKPEEALITMFCCLPVALSLAVTFKIPFASMSKITSICGIPRGAGGMSCRSKRPNDLLSRAISTFTLPLCTVTAVWLSSAVEHLRHFGWNRGVFGNPAWWKHHPVFVTQ